ncbi:hypothetical protein JCM33374_g5364 [Metschnikowia sp. JCM 33374]|nr:hypothetical protein JCM33374_g5364 [Metschnikowia sp. JCM 33374]
MHYSVIIIGGGMAGIKTASDLFKAGETNTLILEARNRLGGRLKSQKSTKDPSVSYDFGASWFHDGLKNPLFEKAKKLANVDYFYDDGKYVYVSEDRKNVPTWEFEQIVADIETFGKLYFEEDHERNDVTVKEMCSLYLRKHEKDLSRSQLKYSQQVVRMWLEMWDGISWEAASAKHTFFWGVDHLGRNAYVKNGYRTVFQNEVNELPYKYQKNNIQLNTQVTRIDYENSGLVKVVTKDGSVLPEYEYGTLGKVIFEFEQCFWPKDVHRFYILASELTSKGAARPWQSPTLIINYSAMSDVPSLVFLTQSPVSQQIEHMKPNEIWDLFEPVIRQIATGPVSKPFNTLKTEWNSDPWARGSYSASRIDTENTDKICEILAGGINNRVRFAGAETIGGSSNGCAHGAFYSGEREARYILQKSKTSSKL